MALEISAFLDADVFFYGMTDPASPSGHILRSYAEGKFQLILSHQLLGELVLSLRSKSSEALPSLYRLFAAVPSELEEDPDAEEVGYWREIVDTADAPIIAAAVRASSDYLVTSSVERFNPRAAERFELHIVTPEQMIEVLAGRQNRQL